MFESFNCIYKCTGACLMWTCFQTNSDEHFTEKTKLTNQKTPNKPNQTKQMKKEMHSHQFEHLKLGEPHVNVVYIYLLRIALGHLK